MAEPATVTSGPAPGFPFRQMLPALVFDVAIPIVIFYLLSGAGVSTLGSLVAGALSPALNNLRIWVKARRLEPLGIIVMSYLAIGTAASLISGDVFFVLIKDSLLTASFGLVCLGSLLAARPVMFYIIRQFVAGDDAARLQWWNGLWQIAEFRAALAVVTTVWGVAYLVEAGVRIGLALTLPPAQVVAISPVMAFGMTFLLIAWSRRHMLALRARRIAAEQQQLPQPG